MGSWPLIRVIVKVGAPILGGMFALSLATSVTISAIRPILEAQRKKVATPCEACKGRRFYVCKLCEGNSTIHWSPLYNPIAINSCLCPTCDGRRIQRCLNCLGKGYY